MYYKLAAFVLFCSVSASSFGMHLKNPASLKVLVAKSIIKATSLSQAEMYINGLSLCADLKDYLHQLRLQRLDRFNQAIEGTNPQQALFWAADHGFSGVIPDLLECNIQINKRNMYHGRTALMMAVYSGKQSCVKELLMHGAQVNIQDDHGDTALMYAVKNRDLKVTKMLLLHNAQTNIQNKFGITPLKYSKRELCFAAEHEHCNRCNDNKWIPVWKSIIQLLTEHQDVQERPAKRFKA